MTCEIWLLPLAKNFTVVGTKNTQSLNFKKTQLTKDDDRCRRLAREDVLLLRHTSLVIERLYERWLLYFAVIVASLVSMFESCLRWGILLRNISLLRRKILAAYHPLLRRIFLRWRILLA